MKRLTLFELKKLFCSPLILFMLLLFSILNFRHIYSDYQQNIGSMRDYFNGHFALYEEISGAWNNDTIVYVLDEYEKAKAAVDAGNFSTQPDQPNTITGYVFGDYGLFEQIKTEMDTLYHYGDTMAQLSKKALENAEFYQKKGNAYQAKVNRKIAKTYQNRSVNAYYDTLGIQEYFRYDFSTLLILLLLLPMLSPLFAKEHETEMYGLLKLTPQYRKLSVCKLFAGMIAVTIVSIVFWCEDFLMFRFLYHIKGLSQPVYALKQYAYSPLTISVGEYALLQNMLKLLCFQVIGGICTTVSSASKNEIIPFCCSFAVALGLFLTDAFFANTVTAVCNPVTLCHGDRLFQKFAVCSLVGMPIDKFLLPICTAGLAWLFLSVTAVRISGKEMLA